jgi:hypothetical protein
MLSFDTVNFSKRQDLDIWMPADLDQFGRENSHRTVICGECLVKLGHMATDAGPLFDQIDFETGDCEIKRSLNAANASANHHDIAEISVRRQLNFLSPKKLFSFHSGIPLQSSRVT